MHILKLPWLNHSEESRKHEVYSVSVSPDGSRLASGGLDGKVRIWSVEDILRYTNADLPKDEHCKPLCSMARHNGAVTAVKFSPDGRFLASGSDDKVLLIWEKDEELRPSFGEQNSEHWTVTKRVVAHDNDIQDIAWAPDSSILVSVGLDRSVIIYNGSTFERLKRFDVHQSTVKGVVFDPANKYFATSSDDRSVRIFRYHKGLEISFSIERTILAPFKKSPLTTYFRRLSWSPDGQHIAAPNATNGPVTSVAIISRGSWESDFSLIGHETPCEVAAFSPVLYEYEGKNKEKVISSVVATGGQDKNLVVWNNTRPNPVAIFEDMTFKTITDLCWTPNGDTLFCSSLDGTISVIHFEPGELGSPVSSEKNDELLNKYGVDKDSMVFPESVEQLILEDKAAEFQKTLSQKQMDRLLVMETKPPQKATPPPVAPPMKINKPIVTKPTASQPDTKLNKVVIKNGKKRVTPTLLSTTHAHTARDDKFNTVTVAKLRTIIPSTAKTTLSSPAYETPRLVVQTAVHGFQVGKNSQKDEEEEDGGDEIDEDESEEEEDDFATLLSKRRKLNSSDGTMVKLQPPIDDTVLLAKSIRCPQTLTPSLLEVLNYYDYENEDDEEVTIIRNYVDNKLAFETYIEDTILTICGEFGKYWALATDSGALLLYTPTGRIMYPRIELGFNVAFMACKNQTLALITEDYILHVYDLINFKKTHKDISLAPILNYKRFMIPKERSVHMESKIRDVRIEDGFLLVELETKDTYAYNTSLRVWQKVLENVEDDYRDLRKYLEQVTEKAADAKEETEFVKYLTRVESYVSFFHQKISEGELQGYMLKIRTNPLYSTIRGINNDN